jgi:hypothetical protein
MTDSTVALARELHDIAIGLCNDNMTYSADKVDDAASLIERHQRELAERDKRIERLEEDARRLEGVIALGLLDGLTATYMADKDLDEADFGTPEYKVACLAAIDAAIAASEGET